MLIEQVSKLFSDISSAGFHTPVSNSTTLYGLLAWLLVYKHGIIRHSVHVYHVTVINDLPVAVGVGDGDTVLGGRDGDTVLGGGDTILVGRITRPVSAKTAMITAAMIIPQLAAGSMGESASEGT